MGTRPREIEAECRADFLAQISELFDWRQGSECYADLFIRPKLTEDAPTSWMPIQLKMTTNRNAAWKRKMRSVLQNKKDVLRGAVLVGYCPTDQADSDPVALVELVHRWKDYTRFDPSAAAHNVAVADLPKVLEELWRSALGVQIASDANGSPLVAESMLAYSPETLVEKRARAFFSRALSGSDVHMKYKPSADEFSCVDGHISLVASVEGAGQQSSSSSSSSSGKSAKKPAAVKKSETPKAPARRFTFRIQEKLLTVRKERGKTASGDPYDEDDADFLLLHARAEDATAEPMKLEDILAGGLPLHGSALIPFRVLAREGYVTSHASPSCSAAGVGVVESADPLAPAPAPPGGRGSTTSKTSAHSERHEAKGKTYLGIYPEGVPGVHSHQGRPSGVLEKYYVKNGPSFCSDICKIVLDEIASTMALGSEIEIDETTNKTSDSALLTGSGPAAKKQKQEHKHQAERASSSSSAATATASSWR
eukprot:g11442.t1